MKETTAIGALSTLAKQNAWFGMGGCRRLIRHPQSVNLVAHRYRIGVNYAALPVNKPHSEVSTYHRDGIPRFEWNEVVQGYEAVRKESSDAEHRNGRNFQQDGEMDGSYSVR